MGKVQKTKTVRPTPLVRGGSSRRSAGRGAARRKTSFVRRTAVFYSVNAPLTAESDILLAEKLIVKELKGSTPGLTTNANQTALLHAILVNVIKSTVKPGVSVALKSRVHSERHASANKLIRSQQQTSVEFIGPVESVDSTCKDFVTNYFSKGKINAFDKTYLTDAEYTSAVNNLDKTALYYEKSVLTVESCDCFTHILTSCPDIKTTLASRRFPRTADPLAVKRVQRRPKTQQGSAEDPEEPESEEQEQYHEAEQETTAPVAESDVDVESD
jgi:hypothetical protein